MTQIFFAKISFKKLKNEPIDRPINLTLLITIKTTADVLIKQQPSCPTPSF